MWHFYKNQIHSFYNIIDMWNCIFYYTDHLRHTTGSVPLRLRSCYTYIKKRPSAYSSSIKFCHQRPEPPRSHPSSLPCRSGGFLRSTTADILRTEKLLYYIWYEHHQTPLTLAGNNSSQASFTSLRAFFMWENFISLTLSNCSADQCPQWHSWRSSSGIVLNSL
jgi:hypothetical protein